MWGYIDEQKVILENILSLQRDTFSTLSKTFISPKEIIITASGILIKRCNVSEMFD